MKRREFLGTAAALTAALSQLRMRTIWGLEAAAGGKAAQAVERYRGEIGIQLYTLRNQIDADVQSTIKAVADAGYKQVEPYGFPNAKPMMDAARDCGLKIHSCHFAWDSVIDPSRQDVPSFESILESAHESGLSHLVIPYLQAEVRQSLDDYRSLCERFNVAAEKAKQAGIQLAYHNHAFEFEPKEGGQCGYDVMVKEFSPEMKFEVDVFWVQVGGKNPADLVRSLKGRVSQLHLKDLNESIQTPNYGSIPPEAFEELGDGVIEMTPILEAAADAGVDHCHVEQDHSPYPLESIRQSMTYLKRL
jgi:sugar phosphate isomerase/epimerase